MTASRTTGARYLDVHIIQNIPPSNINRDDEGKPKTARYGGKDRARVSSQSWKRATRLGFADDEQGTRSKQIAEAVAKALVTVHGYTDEAKADTDAKAALASAGIGGGKKQDKPTGELGYLLLFGDDLVEKLAEAVVNGELTGADAGKKVHEIISTADVPLSLALFGRMVADDKSLSVDAACQVAHAISTHEVAPEEDYFTAVDDLRTEDGGAGMIGHIEFNSSTLYRYASINLDLLRKNLSGNTDNADADAAVAHGAKEFIRSFALSMPTGYANSTAPQTLPTLVLVSLREDRPVSLVGAFERPVKADSEGGYVDASVKRLLDEQAGITDMLGAATENLVAYRGPQTESVTVALGTPMPMTELVESVGSLLAARSDA
ncbi:type I-E CRISPR-associated protein Cas7/Cse4/CasC [Jatrophihabitans lederbergiae]|uniref:Type I-E CRISPR-associated protein Cas7/Cse4/CasC n=1 Tax=Jatrophihabitans lederbergiae TaxID=3075547 RepID=A0ABU2JFM5_9ACTN|nr:type I-E CRISPR-associated protein Cas7/Cse4/CasC [Jatrophihabitans sp. DSM 44399]MDT0263792.1 type I-E CRISPR-associated protein Cas7/Cse4/CasC [Jatrophihabitans sp. DSM 44399]